MVTFLSMRQAFHIDEGAPFFVQEGYIGVPSLHVFDSDSGNDSHNTE